MKSVGAAFDSHVSGETTTIATRLLVTRRDGVIVAFTSHPYDIAVGGQVYSSSGGETPTNIESAADLAVDNLEVIAIIDDDALTEEELVAGFYDYAQIEIAEFNYIDPSMGSMILRSGTLGEHAIVRGKVRVELRGVMQPLQQTIGRVYQKRCDADLYDARCQVNTASFIQSGAVIASSTRYTFTTSGLAAADGWFNNAKLKWLTGANSGRSMEVKRSTISSSITTVEFHFAMPFTIVAGDTFEVPAGCDLTRSTCVSKFNNVVNFRGFPDMPTRDAVLEYPDSPG